MAERYGIRGVLPRPSADRRTEVRRLRPVTAARKLGGQMRSGLHAAVAAVAESSEGDGIFGPCSSASMPTGV